MKTNKTMQPVKAVGYCRYGDGKQGNESIDFQQQRIREYAEREGMHIAKWYIDAAKVYSRKTRGDFDAMIQDAKTGEFGCIIVNKISSFSRNEFETEYYRDELLNRHGVIVRSATEIISDTETLQSLNRLSRGIAQYYLENFVWHDNEDTSLDGIIKRILSSA